MPGTTYIRTYTNILFLGFPFDEIYRRLLFFTLTRYACTTHAVVLLTVQAVSLIVYSLVGGGTHDTYVPPVDAPV